MLANPTNGTTRAGRALLRLAILLVIGCETNAVIDDHAAFEKLYIHCVLSPTVTHQKAYLAITRFEKTLQPINDARIGLFGPAGEVALTAVGEGFYEDVRGSLQLTPGATYVLRVTLADGRQLSATTSVPASFAVWHSLPDDTIFARRQDEYSITYRVPTLYVHGAGGWVTQVASYRKQFEGRADYDGGCLTVGDSIPSSERRSYRTTDSGLVGMSYYFAYYDTAFSIYRSQRAFCAYSKMPAELTARRRDDSINIDGGSGVFGSALLDSLHFFIRLEK